MQHVFFKMRNVQVNKQNGSHTDEMMVNFKSKNDQFLDILSGNHTIYIFSVLFDKIFDL